jgi:hypothetical protein
MSGTLHGSIDHNITATSAGSARDVFAAMVNYFDSKFTRIASQKGSSPGGTGALGGYTSDTNRSGDNAFGVWRWDRTDGKKLYILLQWQYNSSMGSSPGNPATANQVNYGVGMQFAMRLDGGNPWNGTSVNDGTDTKNGTDVWVDGGSTLVVWPRSNGPGGSSTSKSGLGCVSNYTGVGPTRFSVMSDDDTLYWFSDQDGGSVNTFGFFAPYTARSGITPDLGYVCMFQNQTALDYNALIGNTAGNGAFEGGAVIAAADGVRGFRKFGWTNLAAVAYQPNTLASGSPYDIMEVALRMDDTTSPARQGLFGKLNPDDIGVTWNMPNWETNVGKTRVCVGDTTQATYKWVFRWDGATAPLATAAQTGVQF